MKRKWKSLILCLLLPVAVGGVSALLSRSGMENFSQLEQPPLSPPAWLFPVAWTVLYLMMGLASWQVLESGKPEGAVRKALQWYGAQLAANFFWSIIFFRLELYLTAFLWLLLLWALILITLLQFRRIRSSAAWLLAPYLVWVTFAGYLNLGVWFLNR